jgi:sarcosine oxidase, subunit gamma
MSEHAIDPDVRIARHAPGMVTPRGDLAGSTLAAAVTETTDCAIPATRRIAFAGPNAAAWISPDEVMLFLAPGAAAATLEAALAGTHHLAADVSDARAALRLDGSGARKVVAKGAPFDLAPAAFGPGDFRRTRLGQVAAAFWCPEPGVFDLMCFRSVAGFVAEWLVIAAGPGSLPRDFAPART